MGNADAGALDEQLKSLPIPLSVAEQKGSVVSALWVGLAYIVLLCATQRRHEPWADEAQAWLLGRDASLAQLWGTLLRLEGSPGLWHSLLHILACAGMPYAGMSVLSGLLGLAGCVVLVRYAPFPLPLRILLPFTYFLFYQYAVVARSYAVVAVLLFSIAKVHAAAVRSWWTVSVLLSLLAMVSAQAFVLSLAVSLVLPLECLRTREGTDAHAGRPGIAPGVFYLVVLALIACSVWPGLDTSFAIARDWSWSHFVGLSRYSFQQAFGRGYWPLLLLGLSLPLLWKGQGLLFLSIASFFLCVFGSVVYANLWHDGFLVLAWLFALWISCRSRRPDALALIALLAFIIIQCSWTVKAIRYDWAHAYSGSLAMANYLKQNPAEISNMVGVGYPVVAVQPYFAGNLFRNFGEGETRQSYWLWSRSKNSNDASEHLGSMHPPFVLLGYSSETDRRLWAHLITTSGYQCVAHFEGNLFWRTTPVQAESYEFYKAGQRTVDSRLETELDLSSPKAEDQLMWGLSDKYDNTGRWSDGTFLASLQRPQPTPSVAVTHLQLDFRLREEEVKAFGPLALTAYVAGRRLSPQLYTRGGHYRYDRAILGSDLQWAIVPVAFRFEKNGLMAEGLEHQRVAVVRRIGLVTK